MADSSSSDDDAVLVIDNGSGMCKVGLAGEDEPASVFPSVVGRPKGSAAEAETTYVGHDCLLHDNLTLEYPVEYGIVNDFDHMEKVWAHAFAAVAMDPTAQPVLLTEAPRNPKSNREKVAEIMFEKFEVPSLYIALQAVLSLYSTGRTTGLVLDAGDGVTHTVSIFEGYAPPNGINRLDLAGRDLTGFMIKLLGDKGVSLTTTAERETVRDIKEKLCYVAADYDAELESPDLAAEYTLPDGSTITLDRERITCGEALFNPAIIGMEAGGVHQLVNNSITSCSIDVRRDLYNNIILSGGTTCFAGFQERLASELSQLVPSEDVKVKITAPENRQLAVWCGGSILASLTSFQRMLITKATYDEVGASVVHDLRVKF